MALETNQSDPPKSATEQARRYRYTDAPTAVSSPAIPTGTIAQSSSVDSNWKWVWLALGAAAVSAVVLFSQDLTTLAEKWASDSGWSHGFVVPLIALFFIRIKWDTLRRLEPRGSFWGLTILLIGVLAQVIFRATGQTVMSRLSLIVVLLGATLLIWGWQHMKILWLPIAYLIFAMPPQDPLYVKVTTPMQRIAAELGVILMPLFGSNGETTGNLIHVSGLAKPLDVAQACAGMRMLVAFFALAVALAYSTERPVWQKITLAASALPIAILCNGLRVALTGVVAVRINPTWAEGSVHEYLGLLMLGPAMLLQLAMAWVLDRIFVEVPDRSVRGSV